MDDPTSVPSQQSSPQSKTMKLAVQGMHCSSCEVLIEQKLRKVPGVNAVKVSRGREEATIMCSSDIPLEQLQAAVTADGYTLTPKNEFTESGQKSSSFSFSHKRKYAEIGAAFLVLVGLYL